jgi:hypothetical protein
MDGGLKTSFYYSFKPDPNIDPEQVLDHGSRGLTHVNLICFILYIYINGFWMSFSWVDQVVS